jgi:hypothetical protein
MSIGSSLLRERCGTIAKVGGALIMEDMAITRSRPSKRLRMAHGGQFQREKTKNWQDMVENGRRRKNGGRGRGCTR